MSLTSYIGSNVPIAVRAYDEEVLDHEIFAGPCFADEDMLAKVKEVQFSTTYVNEVTFDCWGMELSPYQDEKFYEENITGLYQVCDMMNNYLQDGEFFEFYNLRVNERELNRLFEKINEKKARLDIARPLPKYTLKSLQEKLFLEWTYHSNAIEGNTLTLNETKVVLEGITVGGKTLREHLEVINHREAIAYVEEIVQKKESLSEWQIKKLHRLVLKRIDDEFAGVYRKEQVLISGAKHTPPAHFLIQEKMERLMDWYHNDGIYLHPIERGAMLHAIFVGIHPFIDGNGRTSRLLLNLEVMKDGFPPVVIKVANRLAYYEALDKAHTTEDYSDFITLVKNEVDDSLDLYLSTVS